MSSNMEQAEKAIAQRLADIDWMNPYWLDEVKEEFPDISEKSLDDIYARKLKEKIDSLSEDELRRILSEEEEESSANQNFLLQNLIEEKLGLIENI